MLRLVACRFGLGRIDGNVDDSEVIIRAALSPYHVKKGVLHRNVFDAPPEKDEVSVSRHPFISYSFAKIYCKLLVQRKTKDNAKLYKGLVVIQAKSVRVCGSNVVDSRAEYLGHGDVVHGIVKPPKGMKMNPVDRKRLDDKLDGLLKAANYYEDQFPNDFLWTKS